LKNIVKSNYSHYSSTLTSLIVICQCLFFIYCTCGGINLDYTIEIYIGCCYSHRRHHLLKHSTSSSIEVAIIVLSMKDLQNTQSHNL